MLLDLKEHSKTARLTMNFRKTKVMSNRPTEPFIIEKAGKQLVNEYIYLGQLVTLNAKMSKEIVSEALKAFWAKFILLAKSLTGKLDSMP